jgi:hypothetical protein
VPSEEFGLDGLDLRLEFLNLANDQAKRLSGKRRQPLFPGVEHDLEQFGEVSAALRGNDAELGQMRPHGADQSRSLTHEQMPRPVQQDVLLGELLRESIEKMAAHVDAPQPLSLPSSQATASAKPR